MAVDSGILLRFGLLILLTPLLAAVTSCSNLNYQKPSITVYFESSCKCCGKWIRHLKENSLTVNEVVVENIDVVKTELGVPTNVAGCHTAKIDDYFVEGHVPANDVLSIVNSKPDIAGLVVIGVPVSFPGTMSSGEPFDVYSVGIENSELRVFRSYYSD